MLSLCYALVVILRVLIVDDSKATRELVCSTLEEIPGTEVTETASGFEALKMLPRHRFDLIITDINMPDINGLELINFVKKSPTYRQTPLFILSSEGRERIASGDWPSAPRSI